MCLFKTPNTPALPPAVQNPTEQDASVQANLDAERRRRAAAAGLAATIKTSQQGLTTPATTAPKQLLGQ